MDMKSQAAAYVKMPMGTLLAKAKAGDRWAKAELSRRAKKSSPDPIRTGGGS